MCDNISFIVVSKYLFKSCKKQIIWQYPDLSDIFYSRF